jgi:hypothetical protein
LLLLAMYLSVYNCSTQAMRLWTKIIAQEENSEHTDNQEQSVGHQPVFTSLNEVYCVYDCVSHACRANQVIATIISTFHALLLPLLLLLLQLTAMRVSTLSILVHCTCTLSEHIGYCMITEAIFYSHAPSRKPMLTVLQSEAPLQL